MIGKKLAHYTITGKLGEGGMGVVFEALDGHLDRAVALKLLPHDVLSDPARKQRFVQEAKAASALNHPHIVTIYDIASADGVDYIAMELIRGRTLEQALSLGKLPLAEALKFGVQIADAVAAAHAAGIVHRDLKPGNIIINGRGDVKLLDFGLAKLSEPDASEDDDTRTARAITEEGSVVGSAPYMSPEQAEGRKVDARSDIFSFGAVLYEMLTGRRAFGGASRIATIAAILKDQPESPSSIVPELPAEVERVVTRCLRKDLERRSQSMAEIRIAIQDLKDESASGSPGTQITLPARKPRRMPYYVVGGLLLAAAILALFRSQLQRDAPPLHATVLTSFVGMHGQPSFSPDGNQFAFTWDGDVPKGKLHIYISLVGKGTPLRLTPESEIGDDPSWSPDGQSIAFQRDLESGTSELEIMPSLGGSARRITSGVLGDESWSPDSKWLVWSQPEKNSAYSIRVAPAAGGDPRQLVDPGASKADDSPVISPDGRQIVFIRIAADFDSDLFVADFHDGQITGALRRLTFDHRTKRDVIWTGDGKELLYTVGETNSNLGIYRIAISGGPPRRIEGIGANATSLTLASKSNRLLYATQSTNYDIQRLDLRTAEPKTERFLSSTRFESDPSYSPDGKRIAFDSNRGGVQQIWVADAHGSNPAPLTSFAYGLAGSPKWSPDGQFVVFDARPGTGADIYTVPASGGPIKRLTDYPGEDHDPSWSPDGKWIYFGSRRAGGHEIFRMRTDGSGVQQITHNGGVFGIVTPDGKWLYYSVRGKGLWKMPPDGGDATQVLPREALYSVLGFTLTAQGTYAIGKRGLEEFPIVFYPFDGSKPRTITVLSRPPNLYPAVSPDGRYLLYTISDDPVYEIMLVDNFR